MQAAMIIILILLVAGVAAWILTPTDYGKFDDDQDYYGEDWETGPR